MDISNEIIGQVKTPITPEQFEEICSIIETSEYGTDKTCTSVGVSGASFRGYMQIIGSPAETRYAQAKEKQIENLIDQIPVLNQACLDEIRNIEDAKRCNAIQNAYKEQIRHIEWVASKLKAKKYGDKLDVTSNGEAITREISITPIVSK